MEYPSGRNLLYFQITLRFEMKCTLDSDVFTALAISRTVYLFNEFPNFLDIVLANCSYRSLCFSVKHLKQTLC